MAGGKEWVLDSGCTDHMTRDRDMFRELAENLNTGFTYLQQQEQTEFVKVFLYHFHFVN